MWNITLTDPIVIDAAVLTDLPAAFREPAVTPWSQANKPGQRIDSFLEGPAFDRAGNLYVTDIPNGRLFRIDPSLRWECVAQYDGWPNGIAIHQDGALWIADYRRGLLRIDPEKDDAPQTVLGTRNSEAFLGLNDLTFGLDGRLYFTDQGQTGLHDPAGKVYRLSPTGQLDCLMRGIPSPNGIALDAGQSALFTAVTRANAVWRGPLLADGSLSKVGAFRTFFGASGPDGLAVDRANRLVVAHASLGCAFVLDAHGNVTHIVRSPVGGTVTNVAFQPGSRMLVMTESASGKVLAAELPDEGAALFSHA